MPQLDYIDKRILNILAVDCRTPYREIANSLDLSATAIMNRVVEMVASGVITGFQVQFSAAMIGAEVALFWIKTDGKEDRDQFIQEIAVNRGVMQIIPFYGGDYSVGAEYTSTLELATITEVIKSNPHVSSTEIHTLLFQHGGKMSLTNLQLRVLKALVKDARMMVTDIARETGLTVRLVRRTLRELKESDAIHFSLRWRLNVGDRTTFLLKLKWNPKQTSRNEIVEFLLKQYENEFWEILPSASEPMLFCAATVDNLSCVDTLTNEIKSHPGILYSEAFYYRPPHNYKSLRRLLLEEAVQAAEV